MGHCLEIFLISRQTSQFSLYFGSLVLLRLGNALALAMTTTTRMLQMVSALSLPIVSAVAAATYCGWVCEPGKFCALGIS